MRRHQDAVLGVQGNESVEISREHQLDEAVRECANRRMIGG
jgi:hypothetical protein